MANLTQRMMLRILQVALRALRSLPAFRAYDDLRYKKIEDFLIAPDKENPPVRFVSFPLIPNVIRKSIAPRGSYRLIDLDDPKKDDAAFLSSRKLDISFLSANKSRRDTIRFHEHLSSNDEKKKSWNFKANAFESRGMTAVCPFYGHLLISKKSIIAAEGQPIYYRYESNETFYLAVGRPGVGYVKLYFYFPQSKIVVLLSDIDLWNGRDEIDEFRAYIISQWKVVSDYLKIDKTVKACALLDCNHFAHHIWNSLTGIERLLVQGCHHHIDKLIIAAEPVLPVDDIFPALRDLKSERLVFPDLPREAMKNNCLLIRPGDFVISRGLIEKLVDAAENRCGEKLRLEAKRLHNEHWPIIWVTVRTRNRTWVSQNKGIALIANEIYEQYPKMALIIDGYCIPHGRFHVTPNMQKRIIQEEMDCIDEIRSKVGPSIPIHVNVGKPLFESIIFARITDFYLAHHGSIQHKIGWIANCPGVVHSNTGVLQNPKMFRRSVNARVDAVTPTYLDPSVVTNVSGAIESPKNRWADNLGNYDFDYREALGILRAHLSNPPSRAIVMNSRGA